MGQSSHVRRHRRSWFVYPFRNVPNADGSLGFDYEFNSVEDETNELFCAYKEMFELAVSQNKSTIRQVLVLYFPIIDILFVSEFHHSGPVLVEYNSARSASQDSQEVPKGNIESRRYSHTGEEKENIRRPPGWEAL